MIGIPPFQPPPPTRYDVWALLIACGVTALAVAAVFSGNCAWCAR